MGNEVKKIYTQKMIVELFDETPEFYGTEPVWLRDCVLQSVDFTLWAHDSKLKNAIFSDVLFDNVDFTGCDLRSVDFNRVVFVNTKFDNALLNFYDRCLVGEVLRQQAVLPEHHALITYVRNHSVPVDVLLKIDLSIGTYMPALQNGLGTVRWAHRVLCAWVHDNVNVPGYLLDTYVEIQQVRKDLKMLASRGRERL